MNINSSKIFIFLGLLLFTKFYAISQQWPINQADDNIGWNRVNCTFGEIHNSPPNNPNDDHFHCAVDIDVSTSCAVYPIETGMIVNWGVDNIRIDHIFPIGSLLYNRRSRYIHVNNIIVNPINVTHNDQICNVANANHLHLELWQFENGEWYRINPLGNDLNWEFVSPTDNSNPEINDVILEPLNNQTNNIYSGFIISPTSQAIINYTNGTAKIHFRDRPGSYDEEFNYSVDKLFVFGNIGSIVSVRDPDINGGDNGNALTINSINYSIDGNLKYNIYFDRFRDEYNERYSVDQLFHTVFNTGVDRLFGNNDFIELRSLDNIYVYPQKRINNIQSNGIWFTKALNNTPHIFENTPAAVANISPEALYPDGEHTLRFETEDAAGNRDVAELIVIVDNFRPFIKRVEIYSEQIAGEPFYMAEWNVSGNELVCTVSPTVGMLSPGKVIQIVATTSEPLTSLELTIPDLKNFHLEIPENHSYHLPSGETQYLFTIPSSYTTIDQPSLINPVMLQFYGTDLADNPIEGFRYNTGSAIQNYTIPIRANSTGNEITDWEPDPHRNIDFNDYIDNFHRFNLGCFPGGGKKGNTRENEIECIAADFISSPSTGEAPITIKFFDASVGFITNWLWDFGDGKQTATGEGPHEITYNNSGNYKVRLTVSDDYGNENYIEKDITLTSLSSELIANFKADRTSDILEDPVTGVSFNFYNASKGNPSSWLWDFGDGQTSNQKHPIHTYHAIGDYTVTLTVQKSNSPWSPLSSTESKSNYISVIEPSTELDISCWAQTQNDYYTVTFEGTVWSGVGPFEYEFNFNGYIKTVNSTWFSESCSYTFPSNQSGYKTLTLTVTDLKNNTCTACPQKICTYKDIRIGDPWKCPTIDFSMNGSYNESLVIKPDETVHFDKTVTGGSGNYSFKWYIIRKNTSESFVNTNPSDQKFSTLDYGVNRVLLYFTDIDKLCSFSMEKKIIVDLGYLGECNKKTLKEEYFEISAEAECNSVAISGDYAVVGNYWSKRAYFFKHTTTGWKYLTQVSVYDGYFGMSVDIDGDYAIVGNKQWDGGRGKAYIYRRYGDNWLLDAELQEGTGEDNFGEQVRISGDWAIVAAPWWGEYGTAHQHIGVVYAYRRWSTGWDTDNPVIIWGNNKDSELGHHISIDKNYLAIFGYYKEKNTTGIMLYKCTNGTSWGLVSFREHHFYPYLHTGAFELNEGWLIGNNDVYKLENDNLKFNGNLIPNDTHTSSQCTGYYISSSISNDYAILGNHCYSDNCNGYMSGAAHVFKREGDEWRAWHQDFTLTPVHGGKAEGYYGWNCGVSNGVFIVSNKSHLNIHKVYFYTEPCSSDLNLCTLNLGSGENPEIKAREITLGGNSCNTAINNGVKIIYKASEGITMKDGFTANRGSIFTAMIESCPAKKDFVVVDSNIKVMNESAINDKENSFSFEVFPNPFTDEIMIHYTLDKQEDEIEISIYNFLGEKLFTVKKPSQKPGDYQFYYYAPGLANGIYFCTFSSKNRTQTAKLIKTDNL